MMSPSSSSPRGALLPFSVVMIVLVFFFNSRIMLLVPCHDLLGPDGGVVVLSHGGSGSGSDVTDQPQHVLRGADHSGHNINNNNLLIKHSPTIHSPPKRGHKAKVFGLGLSTAATLPVSMSNAMKLLGYRTIEHDRFLNLHVHHPQTRPNMTGWYDDVDSVWDIPTAVYYKELHEAYPDAKFVLTIQNPEEWYDALQAFYNNVLYYEFGCAIPERLSRLNDFVFGSRTLNKETYIAAYQRHVQGVKEYFSGNNANALEIIDVSAAQSENNNDINVWGQLCHITGTTNGPCWQAASNNFPPLPESDLYNKAVEDDNNHQKQCPTSVLPITAEHPPSKYAYVMILCDPMNDKEGNFLRMVLILAANIRSYDQENDIVVLVKGSIATKQRNLLARYYGIQVASIDPLASRKTPLKDPFGKISKEADECFMAKARALQLTQYEKVIYVDSDIIFESDPRHLFLEPGFVGWEGQPPRPGEPLNGGLYVMTPSQQSFVDLQDIANTGAFTVEDGWMQYGLVKNWNRLLITEEWRNWKFWCAHSDQGLMYYYYKYMKKEANIAKPETHYHLFIHFFGEWKPYEITETTKIRHQNETLFRIALGHWFELSDQLTKEGKLDPSDLSVSDTDVIWEGTTQTTTTTTATS